ncbi:uncharacterized protein [Drosophila kikkawai]|uniref:Uncharacterized protein n=1 Tax=Drosophila kikkawai TaxID=30033 RepID=A0A6P4ICS7_DROKI|nr:uncharacterized protein LOC108073278 [Drosophila kikkawai]
MLGLRVIFALNTILFGAIHGECARSVPEVSNDNLKTSLIQAQSIGRIVNRQSHKEINQNPVQVSFGNDITRASNIDTGYPCVHEVPQMNVIENPPVTRTEFVTQINSHSTFSAGFPMQIQNPRPAQHIHYHYLVPNETPTRPSITYASQSDLNTENKYFLTTAIPTSYINEHYNQLQHSNQEVLPSNPLYSSANHNGNLYDSPDEHQAQGSENTSFYEAIRSPNEVLREKTSSQSQEAIPNTIKPEIVLKEQPNQSQQAAVPTTKVPVYFIKYHGNADIKTTTFPPNHKPDDSSDTITDGSGLIDIRSGNEDKNTVDTQDESNEYSAYNVPLN